MSSPVQLKNGSGFARRGLVQLCDLMSLAELKEFRNVCRAWNDIVSIHPRYREAKIQLGANWFRQANALQLARLTSWRQVTLHRFHYAENKNFFPRVWLRAGATVVHLTLDKVKITCSDFNAFLNICPALETLVISKMDFTPEAIRVEFREAPVIPRGVNRGNSRIETRREAFYCSHTAVDYEYSGSEPLLPPTIKHLRFEAMLYFPHCSLAYLALRCHGTLEKLELENTPVLAVPPSRKKLMPSLADIRPRLLRLVRENAATLTSFTFVNNASGQELLRDIVTHVPTLRVQELVLAVYREKPVTGRPRYAQDDFPNQDARDFIALIQTQRTRGLRNLFFKTHCSRDVQTLLNSFRGVELEKFKLIIDSVGHLPLDLSFLTHLKVLNLELGDVSGGDLRHGVEVPWHWRHGHPQREIIPNCQYWLSLPGTLRSLTVAHKIGVRVDPNITQALTAGGLQLLTKFHVRDGRSFTDEHFQQIIENLVNLNELTVRRALRATDSAFTGLSPNLARTLRQCESCAVLTGAEVRPDGHSLKELIHLRHLDLAGCPGLSDVSCRFGFQFDNLTNLDLSECPKITDIGLFWLGQNNPNLKDVQLRKHANLSHFGINMFVGKVKSVRNMSISRRVLERQLGAAAYVQHPMLPEVVHVSLPTSVLKARDQRRF